MLPMALRLTVFVALMMAPTASVNAANPAEAPADHVQCYATKVAKGAAKFTPIAALQVADAFESGAVRVTKPLDVCPPADKNGEGIVDAVTHLDRYQIATVAGAPAHVKQTGVRVVNQLGELYVDTLKADSLLVPAAKCIDNPAGTCVEPLPQPGPNNVDAYKCYKIKVSKGTPAFPKGLQVSVTDQFTTPAKTLDVKKPTLLCKPASVAGAAIKNPEGDLLCYQVKPASGVPAHVPVSGIVLADQLAAQRVGTKKESAFCVPSVTPCGNDRLDAGEECDGHVDGACPGFCNARCTCPVAQTIDIPSAAKPADTPGSPGVQVTNAKLLTQFGPKKFSLNNARYTRYRLDTTVATPDAILVLVPGFEGGAGDFRILAQTLMQRARADHNLTVEVWAYDRRSNQLEDRSGLQLSAKAGDPQLALDWLFGEELGLTLDPRLPRRAVFYDAHADVPFIANWTPLVFTRDIDAVVQVARKVAKNQNVFLGGHSAGTGFTARYAATDFNLSGAADPDPGYAKLRGLVLLEGGGGSTGGTPLSDDSLDRIIAKFDGGLYGAVRDNAPRCVDGTTACTLATEATDCAGLVPPKCTLATTAYSTGLVNPRILAAVEPGAIQGMTDPDSGQIIIQVDQNGVTGNNAVAKVPDLAGLVVLPKATVYGGIGSFIDDDGIVAGLASFVATSVGAVGSTVNGLQTWQDITEGSMPAAAVPNNGAAPTTLPGSRWGQEKEVTRFDRMLATFFFGGTNFTDWYYPSSGLGTTVAGACVNGSCVLGDVIGAACQNDGGCGQAINLDSTALSVGRGRRDIENLTQAANINIPVIGFGGTNGLAPVPGRFTAFAQSIGPCTVPSCDGATPRVVNASAPSAAFPTFGNANGGFEVHMSEGLGHVDVLTAEDDANNNVVKPLSDFLARHTQ